MSWWKNADDIPKPIGRIVSEEKEAITEEIKICPRCKRQWPDNGKGYCKKCSRKL